MGDPGAATAGAGIGSETGGSIVTRALIALKKWCDPSRRLISLIYVRAGRTSWPDCVYLKGDFALNWLKFRIFSLILPISPLLFAQTFVDPTVERANQANIALGDRVMVAPFATLLAGATAETSIVIGNGSNLQEDITVDARGGK